MSGIGENELICLAAGVRLRKEFFGGLAFNRDNGTVVDVDREAFALLALLAEKRAAIAGELLNSLAGDDRHGAGRKKKTARVLYQLFQLGMVELSRDGKQVRNKGDSYPKSVLEQPQVDNQTLCAPETVHWAITSRCHDNCPDCYARRYANQSLVELGTAKALQVVETLARWGVFQLAVGGGEPLLRPDLPLIAQAAKESGLVMHITTGLIEGFDDSMLDKLAASVKSLHIGIKQDQLLDQPRPAEAHLKHIVDAAESSGVSTGANLILCNTVIRHFTRIVECLVRTGFKRVILLRYKPPADVKRWLAESPSPEILGNFHNVLGAVSSLYPHVEFRLDCALSFLQRSVAPGAALNAGMRGCVAADRILAVAADGSMYPCSQLMSPMFSAGNILDDDLSSIWQNSKVLKKYRFFRNKRKVLETKCGACQAARQCGGCRVFADDALGADPGCENPLLPPARELGREGRKAALAEYFKTHYSISVGEYVNLFQVGQKKAVKELKNTDWLILEYGQSSGNKLTDSYIRSDTYLPHEVQALIGFTSGGAPFVPLETVSEWIEEADLGAYPRWLLLPGQDGQDRQDEFDVFDKYEAEDGFDEDYW